MSYDNMVDTRKGLQAMVGMTFARVRGAAGDHEMVFETESGIRFVFSHYQDCCESVRVEDICGDLEDLVGEPILMAEEVSGEIPAQDEDSYESQTWTFYKFATRKGYVDVRWLGESNGYYSERVDLFVEGLTVAEMPQSIAP